MGRQGTSRRHVSRKLGAYAKAHRQKRRWLAALGVAAAAVVLCVVYALTMPASTLTWDQVDGGEEQAEQTTEEAAVQTASATEDESGDTVLSYHGDGFAVSLAYGDDASLPEGTSLVAAEYSHDSDEFAQRCGEAAEMGGWTDNASDYLRAFDISLEADGQEVEPASSVDVTVTYTDVSEFADAYDVQVYHFGEDGAELLDSGLDTDEGSATLTVSFTTDSFSDYAILLRADSATAYVELDQSSYNGNAYVFWDTATFTTDNAGKITGGSANHNNSSLITSVQMTWTSNDGSSRGTLTDVANANSSSTSWVTGSAHRLSEYFPNAVANKNGAQGGTLVITPADGYYVTGVVVACCGRGNSRAETPYSCNTWRDGNAFTTSFSVGTSGAVSIDVTSTDFSHTSRSSYYFILISVSRVPTPLYVEYNYGAIETILGNDFDESQFAKADTWMTVSDNNVYAPTGSTVVSQAGVKTSDTQFEYMYDNSNSSSETASAWLHYANTITEEAKKQAAAAGYYFAGWYAEYYTGIDVSDASSGDYNNYNYNFRTYYGSATYYETDRVYLYTNVKLTAIWKPIELAVTKTVSGLMGSVINTAADYELTVQKQATDASSGETWSNVGTVTIKVNGNGSASTTLKGTDYYIYAADGQLTLKTAADSGAVVVTPGTYRVVENTSSQNNRTSGSDTSYFESVVYGDNAVITTDSILGSSTATAQTTYNLSVTNSYTDEEPVKTASLTIVKNIYGLTRGQVVGLIDGTYRDDGGLKFDIDYFADEKSASTDDQSSIKGDWTFGANQTLTADSTSFVNTGEWSGNIRRGEDDITTEDELAHYSQSSLTEKKDEDGNVYYQYTITISGLDLKDWYHVWETHVDITGYELISSVEATDAEGTVLENKDKEGHTNRATVFQLTGDTTVTFTNKYTTSLTINKTNADGSTNLSGAGFLLYYKDDKGTAHYYQESADGAISWTVNANEATTLYTEGESGTLTISDLYGLVFAKYGTTFYLKEAVAPNGYQLSDAEYAVSLNPARKAGDLTVYKDGSSVDVGAASSGGFTITVTNTTGAVLPETGGSGTTWFTFGGVALIAAAACGYGLKRSRERRYDRS